MKKNFTLFLFFIYCITYSQYIMNLEASQNGADQIKVHLKVYFPTSTSAYLSYNTEINQNIITLNVCYYKSQFGGDTAVAIYDNDFFIDIPNNSNYVLKVNQYTSWNEITCNYNVLEDTATINFTTPIQGVISLKTSDLLTLDEKIKLFPNPAKNIVNIKLISSFNKIKIFDSSGKLILNIQNSENKIDVSKLTSGIYFIELLNDKGVQRKKLIIQK